MKNLLLLAALCLVSAKAICQDWPMKKKVQEKKANQVSFVPFHPFSLTAQKIIAGKGEYRELHADSSILNNLLTKRPEAIQFNVPVNNTEVLTCDLIKTDLGNVKFTQNRYQQVTDVDRPVCYHGVVSSANQKNNVMLTVNKNYLDLAVVLNDRVIQTMQLKEDTRGTYRLYDSRQISFPSGELDCGTRKEPSSKALAAMQAASSPGRVNAPQDKCVYVFVECFDSLYQQRDSSYQQTIDYVFALFNNIATGYLNEQINIKISTINVWTIDDPYRGDNRENALADLSDYYKDNFWGNICVGLDFSIGQNPGRSGLAGAIGKIKGEAPFSCQAYTVADHPFCYNDVDYNVNVSNFPTGPNVTQQQVYLIMHEMGHLLGSSHTHWCGWLISTNPNTFGALDNCAPVESICSATCTTNCSTCPPCAAGPAPPASGGTIMSYCVGPGEVTSFNNGFGTIPGNTVRAFVDGQVCISNCPSCPANITLGILPAGASHYEASNIITVNGHSSAFAVSTLDAGTRVTLLPGFKAIDGARIKIIINGCGGIR